MPAAAQKTQEYPEFNSYPSVAAGILTTEQAHDIKERIGNDGEPYALSELTDPQERMIFIERKIQMTRGLRIGVAMGKPDEKKAYANELAKLYVAQKVTPNLKAAQADVLKFLAYHGTLHADTDTMKNDPVVTAATLGWDVPEAAAGAAKADDKAAAAPPADDAAADTSHAGKEQRTPRTVSALMKQCITAERSLQKHLNAENTTTTVATAANQRCEQLRQQLEAECGERSYDFDKARAKVEETLYGEKVRS